MIPAFLGTALGEREFGEAAGKLAEQSSDCHSWVVHVSINVDEGEEKLVLICKNPMHEWIVLDNGKGQAKRKVEGAAELDRWIERVYQDRIVGMPCRPIFGSSVDYLTIHHDGRTTRQAIYAGEAERLGCDDEALATEVARRVEELRDAIKE
ncbi:hypothetical protein H0E84_05935 [Luteimonas sp. SJ-92]|uniref:Uncharacterized protein n=1 Tax=Luteimonas salinisoli TaxID=2752307 RepID=A0A853JBB5_9GAMM|nr:hypothetical protein [Luteimonas salinisoli]NZA25918.1 hypothetical protein [Luteimonas salinisoli]